jgi:hypothetical protein
MEGVMKRDVSVSERPLSLPEIVSGFKEFLRLLNDKYLVIVGIDELDKIYPETAAERFLNDIKVIFGVGGVYYFLSVSENILSSFERRGIPLRNAFDSCFDDILQLGHLDLESTHAMLRRRVIGLPYPFVCLCHCLSGGLPRDLIRTCRNLLIESRKSNGTSELAALCRNLLVADLRAKMQAIETAAATIPLGTDLADFFETLRSFDRGGLVISRDLAEKLVKPI